MANRVFVAAIVMLWLSSMTWLFIERIFPSFLPGQPPLEETYKQNEVVAWSVQWGGDSLGYAASVCTEGVEGTTELHNRIFLENAPLMDLAPAWMRHVVGEIGKVSFDAVTRIEFDSLDNFSAFDTRINLNEMPSVLVMSGRMNDSYLDLKIRTGGIPYSTPVYLPDKKALSEALFPEAKLPQMYVGRVWREEVFSPFHSPSEPVEIIQAEVVSEETMEHQGKIRRVMRVEYRGMVGSGVPKNARIQAVSWVEPDGMVLRHDFFVGRSVMRFERLSDDEAAKIGAELFERQIRQGIELEMPDQPADLNPEDLLIVPAA
ncbi:MAG: hypothetical protein KDA57_18265 [Planctomycetales bacterium]|nr:hypothetical protein [Planctomycetales bacterium]